MDVTRRMTIRKPAKRASATPRNKHAGLSDASPQSYALNGSYYAVNQIKANRVYAPSGFIAPTLGWDARTQRAQVIPDETTGIATCKRTDTEHHTYWLTRVETDKARAKRAHDDNMQQRARDISADERYRNSKREDARNGRVRV